MRRRAINADGVHGHSFKVEVSVEGDVDPKVGWVYDHANISAAMKPLLKILDHTYLNDIEGLENPTIEKWQNGFGKNWSLNALAFARSLCTKHLPRAAFTAANSLARTSRNNSGLSLSFSVNVSPVRFLTTRWRSASSCCRGWGAGCREVRQLFSCCRGTLRVPGEWRFARRRRDFVPPLRGNAPSSVCCSAVGNCISAGSSFTSIKPCRASTTAYSIAFCNSRTFPGHE